MCGLAGFYFFQRPNLDKNRLHKMVEMLAHRGPDAEGFFYGRQAAIGHRRLSIIDLSAAAAQPMCDESKRFAVALNGEIYNFRDLRSPLESSFNFFSNSDTEVILRLFQKERENAWAKFNGMFAIAILDDSTNELFLARDHAGIKPLYYTQDAEKFVFASEPQVLIGENATLELDTDGLGLYLQLGYFPAPYTPYKQIRKLPAGHWMRLSSTGVDIRAYWQLPQDRLDATSADPEQQLEALLLRAVERQMISDVPLGAFLSGGIDSALLVALMSRIAGSRVRTFTAGFQGMGYYDERPAAEKVAKLFNTEHHDFAVSESLEDLAQRLPEIFGEPFADSSAIPTLGLAQLTRKHVTVALSGTGADEIFGGYRKYMAAHWMAAYDRVPAGIKKALRASVGMLPRSRQTLWQERALLLQRFVDLEKDGSSGLQLNTIFTPEEVHKLTGRNPVSPATLFQPSDETVVENMMRFDYNVYLPEDLLVKEDRSTMAFGLEARVPYLDREVIEYMHRLPLRWKVSRITTKRLFRKIAGKYLPEFVLKRPKHGFGSPVSEWLQKDLHAMMETVIRRDDFFQDRTILIQKWEEHRNGQRDHSRALWAILMLGLWKDWSGKAA